MPFSLLIPVQKRIIDVEKSKNLFDGYDGNWLNDSATLWGLTIKISTLIEPILLDRTKDPSGFVEGIFKSGEVLYQAG